MTALASFSAPYIFGGNFRVMTTQIVASKLNGELEMAHVETVMLAIVALCGLALLRRVDPGESRSRRRARRGAGPRTLLAAGPCGLCSASRRSPARSCCCCRT